MPPITSKQLASARALLGWSRDRLGAVSETSVRQITYYEQRGHVVGSYTCVERESLLLDALRATDQPPSSDPVEMLVNGPAFLGR
jgi:hypothetical protein